MTREAACPPRLLVTGFGPFPGANHNPTAELMDWLASQALGPTCPPAEIATAIFPSQWRTLADMHARLMARHEPDIAIHFGLHGRARAFHIEQCARNWKTAKPDATGQRTRSSPILSDKPRLLRAPHPAERLAVHLKRHGLPARPSNDAGGYLCNMVFYLSLARAHSTGSPRSTLFIHVPPIAASSGNAGRSARSRSQLRRCAMAVIAQALREFRAVAPRQAA
jgi:pyroglutamyl-peptidase